MQRVDAEGRGLPNCWFVLIGALGMFLYGCGPETSERGIVSGRWYTQQQVESGQALYQAHCAACHGNEAEGLADDWRRRDDNGNYPPPPLNGTAHAWHHSLTVLERTIMDGGLALGGVMPGYSGVLSSLEARSTVAYFQSFWSDDIYQTWEEIDTR